MRLLLFSDLHASTTAASALVSLSRNADVVVGAGDFGNVRRDVSVCLKVLKQVQCPAILVPGNNESYDELVAAVRQDWPGAIVLHGSGTELEHIPFFGIGGGVPVTPFGSWSFDLSEAEAAKLLQNCPSEAVLVSHSPPKGAVDQSSAGKSLGSTSVRDAIVRLRPRLAVCGHIHGSAGQKAFIGSTPVVNAGPAGMLWTI